MMDNYNYTGEEKKTIFTSSSDTNVSTTTPSFSPEKRSMSMSGHNPAQAQADSVFAPLTAQFQNLMNQEPRAADTAPSVADVDLMNYRMSGSDLLFDDVDSTSNNYYGMADSRAESVTSAQNNLWNEGPAGAAARGGAGAGAGAGGGDMIDTFDFLIKSVASANNYVSMLTREQLCVLRAIRPSLLYEFLLEVAKVLGDKRMRRALPHECAFCKNNGENEECYSKHALKDWRGRVLCPVLRAFRCPRCGATGDRAHTIKYCPENNDAAADRQGLSGRRRAGAGTPLSMAARAHPGAAPTPPAPSPSPSPASAAYTHSSLWSTFGMH